MDNAYKKGDVLFLSLHVMLSIILYFFRHNFRSKVYHIFTVVKNTYCKTFFLRDYFFCIIVKVTLCLWHFYDRILNNENVVHASFFTFNVGTFLLLR